MKVRHPSLHVWFIFSAQLGHWTMSTLQAALAQLVTVVTEASPHRWHVGDHVIG